MNRRKESELPFWAVKFKRFRMSKGLSQQETADILGISLGSIRAYEQGLRMPRSKTFNDMHEKLGLDVYEVFFNNKLEEVACRK